MEIQERKIDNVSIALVDDGYVITGTFFLKLDKYPDTMHVEGVREDMQKALDKIEFLG